MPSCLGSEWTDVDRSSTASCRHRQSASLSGGDFATRQTLRLDVKEANSGRQTLCRNRASAFQPSPVAWAVDGHVLPFYDPVAEPPTCSTLASMVKPRPSRRPISSASPFLGYRPDPGGIMVINKSAGVLAIGALVPPLLLGACGGSTPTAPASQAPPAASTSAASTPATNTPTTSASPKDVTEKDFDAANFPPAPKVDNRWYPLTPGTQYVFEGKADRGKGNRAHRVAFTVTDLVKMINGVPAVVLWDRDINEGELQEAELAFQSQDNDGNVWLLGEYPEEYEDGKFSGAPDTWISGLEGAKPGVLMRANPRSE